jgi:Flp pilus assembly protein TadD
MKRIACALLFTTGLLSTPLAQVVTDRNRQDALRHYGVGEQALRREAFDEAEREFQTAVRLDPTLDLAYYGLGQTYMATKRYPRIPHLSRGVHH